MKKLLFLTYITLNLHADELILNEQAIDDLPLFSSVQAKNRKTDTKKLVNDIGKEFQKELSLKLAPKKSPQKKESNDKQEQKNKDGDCPTSFAQKNLSSVYDSTDINDKTFSVSLSSSAKISEASEIIGKLAGIDIYVDTNIKGNFGKQTFKEKTAGQILKHLLPYNNPPLALIKDDGGYQIVEESKAKEVLAKLKNQLDAQNFVLRNADPSDIIKEEIQNFWKITTANDKCTDLIIQNNRIFARGRKDQLSQLEGFIKKIDVPTTQVKIDFVLAASDKQIGLDFGINWSGIYNRHKTIIENKTSFGLAGLGGVVKDVPEPTKPLSETLGNLFVDPTNLALNLSNNVFSSLLNSSLGGNTITVPIVFGGPDLNLARLNLMINAAEAEYKIKVFQRPTMVTLDKETVTISLGRNIPIITNIQDSVDSTVRTVSTFNYKETGVNISVTPIVSPDKKTVSLDLFIEDSEMSGGSTKVTPTGIMTDPPVFEVLKMKNRIQLKNQQTIIVGGLSKNTEVNSRRDVPIISKVPVFGGLFRSKSNAQQNTETFIFITPTIIS